MTPNHFVRRLGPDDAEGWALLRRQALELHPLAFGASIPDEPGLLVTQFRERLNPSTEGAVFGAFVASTMVGIVGMRRREGKKERHKAMLWGMFVTPSERGHGVGASLVQHAIGHARTWVGLEQIHLAVAEHAVEAYRLYTKHGFRPWGSEPHALAWCGQYVDETHMVLDLVPHATA